jgi:ribosomal protein S18 acetylase RimI-like enzyme
MHISFRDARHDDLPAIAELLADDVIGTSRDGPQFLPAYAAALDAVNEQVGNFIIVAEAGPQLVGLLQLTLIPGLSRGGMLRAQIESVRVHASHRGTGLGRRMLERAIEMALEHGCAMVQLTSDKQRVAALRFYEALGFKATHEGLKLML